LTQLLSGKSMSRYLPPNGTDALARSLVKGCSRSPKPPAIIIARALSIAFTPYAPLSTVIECHLLNFKASFTRFYDVHL